MTKLSKILRIVAAAVFLTALAVNVKVTLTDPFVGMSEEAIAQTSSGTDSNQTLPIVENAIGESKTCIKKICVKFDPIRPFFCIDFQVKFGTKVDCNPGGTTSCQPSLCL